MHIIIFTFNFQDKTLAAKYNIDEFPTLMFFKNQIPSVFDEDMENPGEVLAWLSDLMTGADIEQVKTEIHGSISSKLRI